MIAPDAMPSNVEAEAALIGAVMFDNRLVDALASEIDPGDFYEPLHGRLFQSICAIAATGASANPISLKPHFEHDEAIKSLGGVSYLAKLMGSGVASLGAKDFARQIRELRQRRDIIDCALDMQRQAADISSGNTPIDLVAGLEGALDGITRTHGDASDVTMAQCTASVIDDLQNGENGFASGCLPALDDRTGSLEAGDFVIVAGRPGMGKTALAISYALGVARQGKGVLFVSLEMPKVKLGQRMIADQCFEMGIPVDFRSIIRRDVTMDQVRSIKAAQTELDKLPLRIIDAGTLKVGNLAARVRRWKKRFEAIGAPLELVVVDYLQKVQPDTKGQGRYEHVTEVSDALDRMAKDNECAVMALAQLSRAVEQRPDKRPQMSDLRESGQIEQDADLVMLLYRDEYYLLADEPEKHADNRQVWESAMLQAQGKIEIIVAKSRNGVPGAVFGQFHGRYQAVRA